MQRRRNKIHYHFVDLAHGLFLFLAFFFFRFVWDWFETGEGSFEINWQMRILPQFLPANELLLYKKKTPSFGRAEELSHMSINPTAVLSRPAHYSFICCLSKFLTQRITICQIEEVWWRNIQPCPTWLPGVYIWKDETIKRGLTWYILN